MNGDNNNNEKIVLITNTYPSLLKEIDDFFDSSSKGKSIGEVDVALLKLHMGKFLSEANIAIKSKTLSRENCHILKKYRNTINKRLSQLDTWYDINIKPILIYSNAKTKLLSILDTLESIRMQLPNNYIFTKGYIGSVDNLIHDLMNTMSKEKGDT